MTGIRINLAPGAGWKAGAPEGRAGGVGKWGWLLRVGWRGGVVGGVVVLILAVYSVRAVALRHADVQARYEAAVADSIRLDATLERLRELQAQQDSAQARLALLATFEGRVSLWPRLLEAIAGARPAYAWIDRVQTLPAPDSTHGSVKFRLLGIAATAQDLTAYMSGLAEFANIARVTLVGSEPGELAGREVQHFALEGEYVSAPPADPQGGPPIATGEEE